MRMVTVALALLFPIQFAWAAAPAAAPNTSLPTYRVESAEVHISFSAIDRHQRPVTELWASDFTLLRDGHPLDQEVRVERRDDAPIVAAVLTDVSESMMKAVPMARQSWTWFNTQLLRPVDHVSFLEFGSGVQRAAPQKMSGASLTSLYDCLFQVIPQITSNGSSRRVLILFTDGIDNYSLHAVDDVIRLAIQQDVAIYAITTWKYKIKYDDHVLERITSTTGGRYFAIANTREMISALQDISQELRNGYELVFRADSGRGGLHRIAMQSTTRNLRFCHRAAYFQYAKPATPMLVAAGR